VALKEVVRPTVHIQHCPVPSPEPRSTRVPHKGRNDLTLGVRGEQQRALLKVLPENVGKPVFVS
jgi:hypothetical protein